MTRQSTRPTFAAAVLSLALAAAVLTTGGPARAADDDDMPLDSKILRGLMESIGLRKDGEGINYQERAPLVIPPSRTLPPPEKANAQIANNPAWPKDPDVQRAKDEAARERNTIRSATEQQIENERVLRPDELTPKKLRGTRGTSKIDQSVADTYGYGERLKPDQLGYKGGLFSSMFGGKDDEVTRFTGEPPRATLTEPPPGYRTPSPDQPYGLGNKETAPKATDYLGTHNTANQ